MPRSSLRIATVVTRLEGGAGVMALRGARGLDPSDHEVTLITGSGGNLLREAKAAGLEVIVEPRLRADIAIGDDLIATRRLTALFQRRGFDVVHTHCAKAGAVGRTAARRAGTPRVVHTFHGFPFHPFLSSARHRAYVEIERMLGRSTDLALCVGTGVAVEAVRRGLVSAERVRTIGVAVNQNAPVATEHSRRAARHELGIPQDAVVVGAVGRLTYQKAPEHFLAALASLRRSDILGVWIGDGELGEQVSRWARQILPESAVKIVGERSDVLDLLPAFDVFALPSRYEGLPLAIIEAMLCGIPVVATAVNAVPDVVVPGETGLLVPPARPDLFAAAVQHSLDHPAEAARRAACARTRVSGRFTETALAEALIAAYR
jgi:glycosyltransferase involved in cell wall biosynthesis